MWICDVFSISGKYCKSFAVDSEPYLPFWEWQTDIHVECLHHKLWDMAVSYIIIKATFINKSIGICISDFGPGIRFKGHFEVLPTPITLTSSDKTQGFNSNWLCMFL